MVINPKRGMSITINTNGMIITNGCQTKSGMSITSGYQSKRGMSITINPKGVCQSLSTQKRHINHYQPQRVISITKWLLTQKGHINHYQPKGAYQSPNGFQPKRVMSITKRVSTPKRGMSIIRYFPNPNHEEHIGHYRATTSMDNINTNETHWPLDMNPRVTLARR